MDVSTEYIKMCEKAEEIQALFKKPIDLIGAPTDSSGVVLGIRNMDVIGDVWLPRQDQLQEMMARYFREEKDIQVEAFGLCNAIQAFASDLWIHAALYPTMEQLWLAFVMEENHDKMWSREKEEWIKHK